MMKATAAILLGFVALFGARAVAAEAPLVGTEEKAVESYGVDNKTCREWTDGCVVCVRGASGAAACSLPGIACQANATRCAAQTDPALPAK